VLAGCDRGAPSDWERKNTPSLERQEEEAPPPPPAFPQRATLLQFEVRGQRDFRNYIDGATLSVDPKGVIRYVFVASSPSGAENVTYEALRCKTNEYRVYALGRPDRTWSDRPGNWQPIAESRQGHHRTLQKEFFCPQSHPIRSADEGRRALQAGAHPWFKGFSNEERPYGY
jgi:hypothetical protein